MNTQSEGSPGTLQASQNPTSQLPYAPRQPPTTHEVLDHLLAIMNSSDDAIMTKNSSGKIQSWNPAAGKLFGFTAAEMIGQSMARIIPPELQEEEEQVLRALGRGEQTDHFNTLRMAKSGERIPVMLTIAPVRDVQGVIIAASTIVRDLRPYRREQELLEADRRKDRFMAFLGHELRNPVAPICNASELLSRLLRGHPQARDLSELIRRQARQLTRLIDDLLDVARISQGRLDLECRPLRLTRIIAQGVDAAAPIMRAKRHSLIVTPPVHEIYVNADKARLAQCLINLLTNAAKYTDPGGCIRIAAGAEGELARIEISDNGCGIAPELLGHIFDLYVQEERTRDRAQGGLGIGLLVVKRLIELQGGSVQARSAGPGRGATFEIRIPLVSEPPTATREAAPAQSVPRRLFIVDDNVDGASSLSMLLQSDGHSVMTAHTAGDALEQIDAFNPDIALIDIGLPHMDGYELLGLLRSRAALRNTRFVALTGFPREEIGDRARWARFDLYLVKPVDAEVLTRILHDLQMGAGSDGHG